MRTLRRMSGSGTTGVWRTQPAPPLYRNGDENSEWRNLNASQVRQLQRAFSISGKYQKGVGIIPGVPTNIEKAIMADLMSRANQSGLTYLQVLELDLKAMAKQKEKERRSGGGGGGGGGGSTSINIQYNQTSIAQGRNLLTQVLQNALGRAPSTLELQQFITMLNAAENRSPIKTVTNYVTGGGTTTATSRTTPSSVDPEAMAAEFAAGINGGQDFGETQTARFTDMLMARLMGAQNV